MAQWSAQQLEYAKAIVKAGQAHHASDYDIQVALMVALTESGLQNYANSNVPDSLDIPHDNIGQDHNSVGLFQQQVGQWGSTQELMDPVTSANKFFDALQRIPVQARTIMAPWQVAQQVQHSAFQDGSNYKAKYSDAQDLFKNLGYTPNGTVGGIGNGKSPFEWITKSHNWQRIGMGALGGLLVILAVWFILKDQPAVKQAFKTAKTAAEAAVVA